MGVSAAAFPRASAAILLPNSASLSRATLGHGRLTDGRKQVLCSCERHGKGCDSAMQGATRLLAAAAGVWLSLSPAKADLKLCNNTESRVGVALGYKDAQGWASEGWW